MQRNREYWIEKIEENMARDIRVNGELREMGWRPMRFWEKDVLKKTDECIDEVVKVLENDKKNNVLKDE